MDLRTFVSETLVQIIGGVADTQNALSDSGGAINPVTRGTPRGLALMGGGELQYVDFGVAVASQKNDEKSKVISVLAVGGKGVAPEGSRYVSRLKFRVSIGLPIGKK